MWLQTLLYLGLKWCQESPLLSLHCLEWFLQSRHKPQALYPVPLKPLGNSHSFSLLLMQSHMLIAQAATVVWEWNDHWLRLGYTSPPAGGWRAVSSPEGTWGMTVIRRGKWTLVMANRWPLQMGNEHSNLDHCSWNGKEREEVTGITEMKSSRSPSSEQGGKRTQRNLNPTQILSLCD